jgi:hypothetical protein
MSSGIWQPSSGTPYTSAADFSADASHLSGGGGIVTSQHGVVTIRLPSWFVYKLLKLTAQCDVYELLQLTAQYARVFGIQSASYNQWVVPSSSSSPPNVMSTSSSSSPPSMREFLGCSRHHTTSGQPVRSSEEQGARRGATSSVVLYTFTPPLRVRGVLFQFGHALLCHTHLYFPRKRSSNLAAGFVITVHRRTPVVRILIPRGSARKFPRKRWSISAGIQQR